MALEKVFAANTTWNIWEYGVSFRILPYTKCSANLAATWFRGINSHQKNLKDSIITSRSRGLGTTPCQKRLCFPTLDSRRLGLGLENQIWNY